MFHLPDGPAQQGRDAMFKKSPMGGGGSGGGGGPDGGPGGPGGGPPPPWDGVHIDEPPAGEGQRHLGVPYVVGHRVLEFTARRAAELWGQQEVVVEGEGG